MHQHLSTNGNYNTNGRSKRFSSPGYSDYGCDKVNSRNLNGKVGKRSIRSMNEAIEVLADQVEEENMVSLILYDAESLNTYYFPSLITPIILVFDSREFLLGIHRNLLKS